MTSHSQVLSSESTFKLETLSSQNGGQFNIHELQSQTSILCLAPRVRTVGRARINRLHPWSQVSQDQCLVMHASEFQIGGNSSQASMIRIFLCLAVLDDNCPFVLE